MRALLLISLLLTPLLAGCLGGEPAPEPVEALDAAPEATVEPAPPAPATRPPVSPFTPPGDPLADGPHAHARSEWDLGQEVVQGSGGRYLVHVHGSLHAPEGDGPFPVLVFQHGRHGTCRIAPVGFEMLLQPCPDAEPLLAPVDSYTGYGYLAEHLASHGFVVVSVDANNVNDHDGTQSLVDDSGATARARLVLRVLDALADAHAGAGEGGLEGLEGRLDLDGVGLMGHSRGGEGVARAWVLARDGAAPEGVRVGAVFALAPTDFRRWDVRGVPFGTILPYCDGDVFNLQGAWMYDDARKDNDAPIHQFLTLGANHNYYNTVWTGSDWTNRGDPHCDQGSAESGRDSPEEQRRHGLAVMGAFLRRYVGGDASLAPHLEGRTPWPTPGVVTSFQPVHAEPVEAGRDGRGGTPSDGLEMKPCAGNQCPAHRTYTIAAQAALKWDGPASYVMPVNGSRGDLSLRIAADPVTVSDEELDGITLRVVSADSTFVDHHARDLGLFVPPGDETGARTILNTVRVPLDADATAVVLRFASGAGVVQTTDWLYV